MSWLWITNALFRLYIRSQGSWLIGISIAVVIAIIILLVIGSSSVKRKIHPLGYIAAVFLAVMLSFQMKNLSGAVKTRKAVRELTATARQYSLEYIKNNLSQFDGYSELIKAIESFTGTHHVEEALTGTVFDQLTGMASKQLNSFMLFRVIWTVLLMTICSFLIVFTADGISHKAKTRSRSRDYMKSSGFDSF